MVIGKPVCLLTLWMPALPAMQGWVDVGQMGCSSLAAQSVRHLPIKRYSFPQSTSLCCISPGISKFKLTFSVLKQLSLTIIWCLKLPMAFKGLIVIYSYRTLMHCLSYCSLGSTGTLGVCNCSYHSQWWRGAPGHFLPCVFRVQRYWVPQAKCRSRDTTPNQPFHVGVASGV